MKGCHRGLSAWSALFILVSSFFVLSSCHSSHSEEVDRLNDESYYFHYRDLDSAQLFARQALSAAGGYGDGRAEALNNLAFVCIARMEYEEAYRLLDSVSQCTDNHIELLVADVQRMRLCQRMSRNKEFYDYRERAAEAIKRIDEERGTLPQRLCRRMTYAESEFAIVTSTYHYYIGNKQAAVDAINSIEAVENLESDTAQYAAYLYFVGSGGIIDGKSKEETEQEEWQLLIKCHIVASRCGLVYWQADALQALSEHLLDENSRQRILADNALSVRYINNDNMPDSLLAGYLAQKSLDMFSDYGDVYQTAGAYRTLSACHWALGDNNSALACLENALYKDSAINLAPDLIAGIRERMSLTYSAMNDKTNSDINRNLYLDMQDTTRQDRHLEARAARLDRDATQLNIMIAAVVLMIVATIVSLFLFTYLRRRKDNKRSIEQLLEPLRLWQQDNERKMNEYADRCEVINEAHALAKTHIETNKRLNMDNRAKLFLVNSAMPLIDRMINELAMLLSRKEDKSLREERFAYVTELTDKINDINAVLTEWIKLRQGQLSLHIESFRLQDIFDIVKRSDMAFKLKDIELNVEDSDAVVKADKILTLFMLNTIADNARKFTPRGGKVNIKADNGNDYVEISVSDTGQGMTDEQQLSTFNFNLSPDRKHGFGLANCKGIIEKYRKTSKVFGVCHIGAESKEGKGSRFFFRLPKGVMRVFALLFAFSLTAAAADPTEQNLMREAGRYADSAYYHNLYGAHSEAIEWADSARECLNKHYLKLEPDGKRLMTGNDNGDSPAELTWFRDSLPFDYEIILDIRNETAVAALATHDWALYTYNNSVYTQLYKEMSADSSLSEYVRTMQRTENGKTVAVILLLLLLAAILIAYYSLYYRHIVYFRFCVEQVNSINETLSENISDNEKLQRLNNEYSTLNFPESLKNIVERIRTELENSIQLNERHSLNIEIAEDELRKAEYENRKLHVSNNVMDNCLSTLKHETMYYPSRIKMLLDNAEDNLQAIDKLARYYKQLYSLLSLQAMSRLDNVNFDCEPLRIADISRSCHFKNGGSLVVNGDATMLKYLFDTLQRQSNEKIIEAEAVQKDDNYVAITFAMPAMPYRNVFAATARNIPFLVCRQIVRENSIDTSHHGCGITAYENSDGGTIVTVVLTAPTKRPGTTKDTSGTPTHEQ